MENKTNSLFMIYPEFQQSYKDVCESGKEYLSGKNIAITGIIRNIDDCLKKNIQELEQLEQLGVTLKYFIYENDSSDNTKNILSELNCKNSNFAFLSENLSLPRFGSVKNLERTTNLAKHRNKCLDYIKKHYSDSDFTIVIDLDFQSISLSGILHSFGIYSKYYSFVDGIAGNSFQIKKDDSSNKQNLWNYDSWAYRGNWWDDLYTHSDYYTFDPMLWFGLWQPPIGSHPLPVNSAFGGCCIYKTQKYILGKYEGYDCEHVCFHKYLFNNHDFKLYLNPAQVMLFK
jgi:hypothetical protein